MDAEYFCWITWRQVVYFRLNYTAPVHEDQFVTINSRPLRSTLMQYATLLEALAFSSTFIFLFLNLCLMAARVIPTRNQRKGCKACFSKELATATSTFSSQTAVLHAAKRLTQIAIKT